MGTSEESITFAKKYLEDLLSFFGLNIDVGATSEDGEVIELTVPSTHMNGFLIGNNGDTMRSFQYLTSMALKSAEHELNRVNVDIAEYKKQRASRLEEKAEAWLAEVKESLKDRHLPPMNSADRRTIHKFAGDNGIETESEGYGRDRHIVLKAPAVTSAIEEADVSEVEVVDPVEPSPDIPAE